MNFRNALIFVSTIKLRKDRDDSMEFIIGSKNPAKVKAATEVITTYFPEAMIREMASESGVHAQPIGDEETVLGAVNRAEFVRENHPEAIGIGLEGGVRLIGEEMYICNWGALSLPNGKIITAGGAQIPLPSQLAAEIKKGKELGPVMEMYVNDKNIRQKEGAMGIFTAGKITRVELFSHIMQLLIGQLMYLNQSLKD